MAEEEDYGDFGDFDVHDDENDNNKGNNNENDDNNVDVEQKQDDLDIGEINNNMDEEYDANNEENNVNNYNNNNANDDNEGENNEMNEEVVNDEEYNENLQNKAKETKADSTSNQKNDPEPMENSKESSRSIEKNNIGQRAENLRSRLEDDYEASKEYNHKDIIPLEKQENDGGVGAADITANRQNVNNTLDLEENTHFQGGKPLNLNYKFFAKTILYINKPLKYITTNKINKLANSSFVG